MKHNVGWLLVLILAVTLTSLGSQYLIPNGEQERNNAILAERGEIIPFNVDFTQPFDIMLSTNVHFLYNSADLARGFDLGAIQPFTALHLVPNQFRIDFSNRKMLVSANITNADGQLILRIINNEWTIRNPDTLLYLDRNYNAYAFEIIGENGKPTLQVVMAGPNKIAIGGLFYTKTGGSIYIEPVSDRAMLYVNVRPDQHLEENATVTTIFEYPCLTNPSNLGKMINPVYPSSDPLAGPNNEILVGVILSIIGGVFAVISGIELTAPLLKKQRKIQGNNEAVSQPTSRTRKRQKYRKH